MKQITRKDIEKVLLELTKGSEDQYFEKLDIIEEDQPGLVDFVWSLDEYMEEELEVLNHTVSLAWYIIKKILKRKNRISEDFFFEQFQRNYVRYTDRIHAEDTDLDKMAEELHYPNNQPYLVDYLAAMIIEVAEDPEELLRIDIVSDLIVYMKTAVDCLVIDEDKALAEVCDNSFSDEKLNTVNETIAGYIDEFKKTPLYFKLKPKEKDSAESVITSFSEMMYRYFLMIPVNWNARRVVECLTEIMPAKVVAGEGYFKTVEPVLIAFMTFCDDKKYVAEGKTIIRRLSGITGFIIDELHEEEHMGIAKSLLKEAQKKGVTPSDEKGFESFVKEYSREKGDLFYPEVSKKAVKLGRNDTCPCGSGKKYKNCCGAE